MKINFTNTLFSSSEIIFILERLQLAKSLGYIQTREENNYFLIASYHGVEEKGITPMLINRFAKNCDIAALMCAWSK